MLAEVPLPDEEVPEPDEEVPEPVADDPEAEVEPLDELPLTVKVLLTTGQICPLPHALK